MRYFLIAITFGIKKYHISYVQSNLALIADYISILLLLMVYFKLKNNKGIIVWCVGLYILYNVQGIYLENGSNMVRRTSKL